jgi:Ca2+-binding EF-hand superfamily protein
LDKNLPDWFKDKDANHDGQIAMAEFASSWTEKVAAEFLLADRNGDGIITEKECLLGPNISAPAGGGSSSKANSSLMAGRATLGSALGSVDERYQRYAEDRMKAYDKNSDSVLDAEELKAYTKAPANADKDGDGKLTLEELGAALQALYKK